MRPLVASLLIGVLGLAACDASGPDPGGEDRGQDREVVRSPEPEGSRDAPERGPVVVFMGTSLTEGWGLSRPDREAWPVRLQALADSAGAPFRVVNAGLSGETSAGARNRIDWVLRTPPDVFVLETGANDGLRGLPPEAMEANLDTIFSRVRARVPEAVLVLAGMEAPSNMGAGYQAEFRAVFPRVAERWEAHLVPFLLEGVAGVPELNQPDRIHPTAEGHRTMARTAWEAVGPALAARNSP
jgi:acyl-CoA thioesterase I